MIFALVDNTRWTINALSFLLHPIEYLLDEAVCQGINIFCVERVRRFV